MPNCWLLKFLWSNNPATIALGSKDVNKINLTCQWKTCGAWPYLCKDLLSVVCTMETLIILACQS